MCLTGSYRQVPGHGTQSVMPMADPAVAMLLVSVPTTSIQTVPVEPDPVPVARHPILPNGVGCVPAEPECFAGPKGQGALLVLTPSDRRQSTAWSWRQSMELR
jgi:hypothetical protein